MNKEEYAKLHYLLAKLKYELEVDFCSATNQEHAIEIKGHIEAIDDVMKVFIIECD